MLILKYIDSSDVKAVRAYRLQVKERIYKFNYVCISSLNQLKSTFAYDYDMQEILSQLEKSERLEKLEETFQSVKESYERILDMI